VFDFPFKDGQQLETHAKSVAGGRHSTIIHFLLSMALSVKRHCIKAPQTTTFINSLAAIIILI
jgi:hypothetical protein